MARARLRIVTVRDEDVLNNEPPDSKAVPVASPVPEPARKASVKAPTAKSAAPKAQKSKAAAPKLGEPKTEKPKAKPAKGEPGKPARASAKLTGEQSTAEKHADAKRAAVPVEPARVADIMTKGVVRCSAAESLASVGQLMWDNDVGIVVVVDEAQKPVSVVTDRDLAMAAYTQGIALGHIGVGTCMSKRLVTCSLEANATQVAALMSEFRVRRVPVVDAEGVLVGLVGVSDLLTATDTTGERAGLTPVEVHTLLGSVLLGRYCLARD